MADETAQKETAAETEKLQDFVAAADTGGRSVQGWPAGILFVVPLAWSLFQLWYASPLPFMFRIGVFNDMEARSIHLAFAIFLAFTAFPALKRSPRDRIPLQDWIFALIGASCAAYLFLFYQDLARRPGAPTTFDLVVSVFGIILLLEATRRALGPPLMVVALVFLTYTFAGPYMPDIIAHRGASIAKTMSHQWLTAEGVFGVAVGVSTGFVFLFVLFGALLEKAGAGNYFIQVAFSLLGHLRGGPAKAAVVASGMTGLISGSSIANVVTTGTFTIPLMKRVGFSPEKAGAVEVASSVNGQITPPVMGAAAFLMVEYVGIPYTDVIRHAFLPAVISYIALVYIVHLEAMKAGMQGLQRAKAPSPWLIRIMNMLLGFIVIAGLAAAVYYGLGWVKVVLPDLASIVISLLIGVVYIGLLWYAARFPELIAPAPDAPVLTLPETGPTVKSGLYFLLPVVVLVWALMVERLSPGLSAFWATVLMIIILLTQRPITAFFRRRPLAGTVSQGFHELVFGLVQGARNMIGIAIATATAGIIVGTVTLTGIGAVMTDLVEVVSGGNVMLMLMFTALISLILGMGLPTTANYIVVSSLMAPVIYQLGAQSGLIVPLIAIHLFVFYFGIMADVTPPVGLAAFAASAVSGGDPIKTGIIAFYYSMRTVLLPFLFIFNTDLLLIDVEPVHGVLIFFIASIAMMVFAAGTQGWFLVRNRLYESVILLLVAFTLLRPGFWMDMIAPPYEEVPPANIAAGIEEAQVGSEIRIQVRGEDWLGVARETVVLLPVPPGATGEERLENAGLELTVRNGDVIIDFVAFGSPAQAAGFDFDQQILTVQVAVPQPPKELMFIPALIVLAGVWLLQWTRRQRAADAPQPVQQPAQ
jgi:TRAP transporter 4TM/12TM fusion protein